MLYYSYDTEPLNNMGGLQWALSGLRVLMLLGIVF